LKRTSEAAGRDPTSIDLALLLQTPFDWRPQTTQDGAARRMFTGSSTDMAEDAAALSAIGLRHVALRLGGDTIEDAVARIERFGAEVIARSAA